MTNMNCMSNYNFQMKPVKQYMHITVFKPHTVPNTPEKVFKYNYKYKVCEYFLQKNLFCYHC